MAGEQEFDGLPSQGQEMYGHFIEIDGNLWKIDGNLRKIDGNLWNIVDG